MAKSSDSGIAIAEACKLETRGEDSKVEIITKLCEMIKKRENIFNSCEYFNF